MKLSESFFPNTVWLVSALMVVPWLSEKARLG